MRSALFFSCLLVLWVSARAPAQSTLTLATVFPFDAEQLQPPHAEIVLKHARTPFNLLISALVTPQGWKETKFSSEYKAPWLEASAQTEFTPQELKSAQSKGKLTLKDWLVAEGDLQMGAGHFRSSTLKLRLGPSALNLNGSVKLLPNALVDERLALNVSRSLELGDLHASTLFDRRGFREQTLTVSSSLGELWSLSMTATLRSQGLVSQVLELGLSWELWNASLSVTVTSHGLSSESFSLDGMLNGLLVQISLEFAGWTWTGLQAMVMGTLDALSVNALAMLSPDSVQMVTLELSRSLWGWQTHVKLDLMGSDLSDLDVSTDVTLSGKLWDFSIESALSLRFYEVLSASVRITRVLARWTGSVSLEFSAEGLSNGRLTLERHWQLR